MAAVAMTLDEIIAEQKKQKRTGGGGGGGGGRRNVAARPVRRNVDGAPRSRSLAGSARKAVFDDAPAGKWKHDKFLELYGGGGSGAGGARRAGVGRFRAGGSGARAGGRDTDDIVKINISNLSNTVVTSDLEELFGEFDVLGVAVHYDEGGNHLGTADLFVSRPSANQILREFVGVVLDGKEMRFALVDDKSTARPSIRDRLQRVGGPRGNGKGGVQKRVSGGGGPRGGRKSDPGGAAKRISKLSADDLDKELEAYMGKKEA